MTARFDRLGRTVDWVRGAALRMAITLQLAVSCIAIIVIVEGPRRLFSAFYRSRKRNNGSIAVDLIPFSRKLADGEKRAGGANIPARPHPPKHPFKLRTMRQGRYPDPAYVLRYKEPPLSGLILAGVGETEPRRTVKFYHDGYGHIYGAMNFAFHLVAERKALWRVQRTRWDNRKAAGPVAITRQNVSDPARMAEDLKARAKALGAASAGCTKVTENALYAHVDDYLPNAIVVTAPMDRGDMLGVPSQASGVAIIDGYFDVGHVALELAAHIRSLGWRAEADTNLGGAPSKVMHIPLAVAAGLGEMGRHTSLITPEFGANVRLATVLTDIPIAFDSPRDFGIEDFCVNCHVCSASCPTEAIYEDKQMVRGIEKWHLDFDRCMPYFNENDTCGICITACPWSETGKAPLLTMLQQQRRAVQDSWPLPLTPVTQLMDLKSESSLERLHDSAPENWWQEVDVTERCEHPGDIIELSLKRPDGSNLPDWSAGAHVEVMLPSGKVRAYSLSNLPSDRSRWRLGIKVEKAGTGGSHELSLVNVGDRLLASRPGNNSPLREQHEFYHLCAGGIGVTPMISYAHRLRELGKPFEVHYSVKAEEQAIFAEELRSLSNGRLVIHTDREWLDTALADGDGDQAVFVCGPSGFMDAVRERALKCGIHNRNIYSEDFGSGHNDKPFDLVLGSSGKRLRIEPGQTIARELMKHGIHVPISCGYGICGTCTVGVLSGQVDARDRILPDDEKLTKITLCCSRALSDELVVDI